jgi:hypothetical protein
MFIYIYIYIIYIIHDVVATCDTLLYIVRFYLHTGQQPLSVHLHHLRSADRLELVVRSYGCMLPASHDSR